ncbi:putative Carbon catabolite-derepressing protein kinase [Blattamonas nauphoetae]|uniref:Carbon catabolite-derepressing protein kinase n=1 Tax=Blattamonas nauphoetae TaxID=2049346 RepID=A0ABQ9WY54_9EUKA|nr:putative Carbon catabolite-derepressing protein kinase [Blattamonas nauphoetae]
MADLIKVPEGCVSCSCKMVQCLTEKDIERFDREVGRLRRFNHARIIKLKEVVTMDNTKVMVMELGGKSLAEIVKDLTERKVLMAREDVYRVMEDIASALELMHSHADGKTAHGDVKMENILIDADGHAKLCDFGAAESESVSNSRSVMTQMYVSPERMESETGRATCSADVWSLGVVLFWLLFGESPIKGKTPTQLIREIASFKATDIPNSCGEKERALLMRMMDTSAESRVTCRQLLVSKSFRCIVNTIEGVWKLNEEEQARRVAAEKQKREMTERNEELKLPQAEDKPVRTAFTHPIDEGEWELKIRASFNSFDDVSLGFLRHPLPEDATQRECGYWENGIGGYFTLWNGSLWKGGEFKPDGTNKKCDRSGQTAAIRVNMTTREARLFVDDSEQPGIFTDIPSPLCLGITTHIQDKPIEVLWLMRLRGNNELEKEALEERRTLKSENEIMKLHLVDLPIWVGTESLQTLDRSVHTLTPTTLTQIIRLEDDSEWRTAFTRPIDEGEWELKIRARENTFWAVNLGFLRHPLPEEATEYSCGYWENGIGGDFTLWDGRMWRSGTEYRPEGTNKKCDRIGQTAAIRVNMKTREARLVVDDEEQPGIFTDIPSPLCLGISTGFVDENLSVEVLWLKRLRGCDERERLVPAERRTLQPENEMRQQLAGLPIWVGTASLQTLDRTAHALTPTTLTQIITLQRNCWCSAFTLPIDEGEWELTIRARFNTFFMLGFLRHPLPEDATVQSCGFNRNGFGGHFTLWDGRMWKTGTEYRPEGTNKKCDRIVN